MLFIERFLDICTQYPQNIAIETDGSTGLTYEDLRLRSYAIANHLSNQGIKQGDIVAINLHKSDNYIACIFGCWLMGAAYMPLDPKLPTERRNYILNEAEPKLILDEQELELAVKASPSFNVFKAYTLDSLAYVIFTSGSTGQPKGVMVSHSGLVNCIDAQITTFRFNAKSRSLFYLSTNFDASLSDIGTALLSGATLLIETAGALENAGKLPALLNDRQVTHMDIPPSLLRLMKTDQMPASLETIIIGGEACPIQTVIEWSSCYNLVNVYGPTEATICTSMVKCDPKSWALPLIGTPLPNVDYILINDNQEIIQGTGTGELLIGGQQLAIGYMNQDELNTQKFIQLGGERYYRTGDMIKRHANDGLEFLGRVDRQVKINGQLVELEEVETKLSEHDDVERAAVIKKDLNGRAILLAFISLKTEHAVTSDQLKFWLKARLPQWMVPQHFILLDEMPKTLTGKIDYAPLKSYEMPKQSRAVQNENLTATEREIKLIWEKILKCSVQSAKQNFFTLGGDSMAVLELSLEAELKGYPLTTNTIVEFPTIAAQAAWLEQQNQEHSLDAGGMLADALVRDIAFDDIWQKIIKTAAKTPKASTYLENIFFTGGTGYLGAQLLYRVLQTTEAKIYTLVRAETPELGLERIEKALAIHQLTLNDAEKDRLEILRGDFSQPYFGLPENLWMDLSQTIDTVFHIGAIVNTVAPYEQLRPANVGGTQEIVKFALSGQRKAIHYASTLSVFVSTDQNEGPVLETDRLEQTQMVYGGYGQSKWAAERFLLNLPANLCDLYIYRLGLITGDTRTGTLADHDFLKMFVKGLTNIGAIPEGYDTDLAIDVTPVNYASEIMNELALKAEPNIYHIANKKGLTLQNILDELSSLGQKIDALSVKAWRQYFEDSAGMVKGQNAATFLALCRLFDPDNYQKHRAMDLFQATNIIFDTNHTEKYASALSEMHTLNLNELTKLYITKALQTC